MRRIVQAGPLAGAVLALLGALALAPAGVHAQLASTGGRSRVLVAGDLMFAQTLGEFHSNVKQGFGGGVHAILPIGDGILGARFDLDYLQYGQKTRRAIVSTPFESFYVNQTTTNSIIIAGVGPQLMAPRGPIRPYVNALFGFSRFYTQSTLDNIDSDFFDTNRTESSDWQLTYGAGGGVYIPIGGPNPIFSLDIGVQYHVNGRTTYLTPEDISQDPNTGELIVTPSQSEARFVTYRVGAMIAF